jgi:hypothetical protein
MNIEDKYGSEIAGYLRKRRDLSGDDNSEDEDIDLNMGIHIESYSKNEETGICTYNVTIDDDVNINKFLDKYKIIKQEGKIYTIIKQEIN